MSKPNTARFELGKLASISPRAYDDYAKILRLLEEVCKRNKLLNLYSKTLSNLGLVMYLEVEGYSERDYLDVIGGNIIHTELPWELAALSTLLEMVKIAMREARERMCSAAVEKVLEESKLFRYLISYEIEAEGTDAKPRNLMMKTIEEVLR